MKFLPSKYEVPAPDISYLIIPPPIEVGGGEYSVFENTSDNTNVSGLSDVASFINHIMKDKMSDVVKKFWKTLGILDSVLQPFHPSVLHRRSGFQSVIQKIFASIV